MDKKERPLQTQFLSALRREHAPVDIYLVSGIKLQGQIESFDQYVILLKSALTQAVYKHAVSTIVPTPTQAVAINHKEKARPAQANSRRIKRQDSRQD